ncbi:hypothetical protein DFJ73DRAFT_810802 [Zopfochytrium polystomum]|nr:hypothetical protein DFJ73DRAFT_810802 [Zopfochytrium polystomum]
MTMDSERESLLNAWKVESQAAVPTDDYDESIHLSGCGCAAVGMAVSAFVNTTLRRMLSRWMPPFSRHRDSPFSGTATALSVDYPIRPVPFTAVRLHDGFWAPRITTNRTATIPFAFRQCMESDRIRNFEAAAAALRGTPWTDFKYTIYPFDDTDLYKVIEGSSFSLSVQRDAKLESIVDEMIEKIAAAQEPDGYIYTARTFNPSSPHKWAGPDRWYFERSNSHELYCFGHLFEAAAAHYQATKKRSLLNIAMRAVDLLDKTFGPSKRSIYPGHQIVEMGLIRLFRITGDERCLRLARFFLDSRVPDGFPGAGEYNQSHQPVTLQSSAVGHAVRAAYMYAGMADVAVLTGNPLYTAAIDRIWKDVVSTKLYVTGGIGARDELESFGDAYELPNDTAYNETCASIANVFWNHRLFLLHGQAQYADVMECTLYNALLAGVSLDGLGFFYPNPLESFGGYARSPWFGCACCPGNMTRFLASVSGYQYAVRDSTIFVNLYASGTATIQLDDDDGTNVVIQQETQYPWDGTVLLTVSGLPRDHVEFELCLRFPRWGLRDLDNVPAFPGGLYSFTQSLNGDVAQGEWPTATVLVDGVPQYRDASSAFDGYLSLRWRWVNGTQVALSIPMPIWRIISSPQVVRNAGRVALQRGPLVYCVESVDNAGIDVHTAVVPRAASIEARWEPELLGGVMTLRVPIENEDAPPQCERDSAYGDGGVDSSRAGGVIVAIPYYAWGNRGDSHMNVWLRDGGE